MPPTKVGPRLGGELASERASGSRERDERSSAGIWSRDIRFKSNLPLTEINKILKNLESKKIIKAVKSVAVSAPATSGVPPRDPFFEPDSRQIRDEIK